MDVLSKALTLCLLLALTGYDVIDCVVSLLASREQLTGARAATTSQSCHQLLRESRRFPKAERYRPSCHDNDTYKAVQCFQHYCWCSRHDGTLVRHTITTNGQPDCNQGACTV